MTEHPGPRAAAPQVARALSVVTASVEELAAAFELLAERHPENYELWSTSRVLAGWEREDLVALRPFRDKYGRVESDAAGRLRAALFAASPEGLHGQLADLGDVAILAHKVHLGWTIVAQGAKELHDAKLGEVADIGSNHAQRAIRWIRTQVKHIAPEALAVPEPAPKPAAAVTRA